MNEPVDSLAAWTALLEALEDRADCLLSAARSEDALTAASGVPELVVPPQCGALPRELAAQAAALLGHLQAAEAALAKATGAVGRELAMLGRVSGDRTSTSLYVDVGL